MCFPFGIKHPEVDSKDSAIDNLNNKDIAQRSHCSLLKVFLQKEEEKRG